MTHIPYTYLIGWSEKDLWYYGVRYAKDCHPDDLWTRYFTSSHYVQKLRETIGEPDVVQVRRLFDSAESATRWESKVLTRLKVTESIRWVNKHSNKGFLWDDDMKEKRKATYVRIYGVESPIQSESIKEQIRRTNLLRFGVENPSQAESVKLKKIQTSLERFGVEYTLQAEEVKERIKQTNIDIRGVEYPMQSDAVQAKRVQTFMENYGVDNPSKCANVREKYKQSCLESLGYENPSHSPEVIAKRKATMAARPVVVCPHCGLVAKDSSSMRRWHFDKCRHKA